MTTVPDRQCLQPGEAAAMLLGEAGPTRWRTKVRRAKTSEKVAREVRKRFIVRFFPRTAGELTFIWTAAGSERAKSASPAGTMSTLPSRPLSGDLFAARLRDRLPVSAVVPVPQFEPVPYPERDIAGSAGHHVPGDTWRSPAVCAAATKWSSCRGRDVDLMEAPASMMLISFRRGVGRRWSATARRP